MIKLVRICLFYTFKTERSYIQLPPMKKLYSLLIVFWSLQIVAQSNFPDKPKKQFSGLPKSLIEMPEKDGSKSNQNNVIQQLSPVMLSAKVTRDEAGVPVLIEYKKSLSAASNGKINMTNATLNYLKELKPLLQVQNPEQEFDITNIEQDALNHTHIRLQQTFKGVPVYGGEMILHGSDAELNTLNGHHFKTPTLTDVVPTINETQAAQFA